MIAAIKEEKKYLLCLLFFYTLTQGLILIVSGMWFDDWCIVNISSEGLKMWASEMGKPEFYPIVSFLINVPEFIYKALIFTGYYIVTATFFLIAKKCILYRSIDALCLTLIYLSMPVNDARIERLGLPYTIGLTLFLVALCLLVYKYDELKIVSRIVILALFFFSYILNSMLVFMGLVWIYIIIREKNIKGTIRKADFFVVPFVFYIIKHVFFQEHGVYTGYNSVTVGRMISSVESTIKAASSLIGIIISFFADAFTAKTIIVPVLFCVTWIVIKIGLVIKAKENVGQDEGEPEMLSNSGLELILGLIVLFAGVYPYVVVGSIVTTLEGFNSRNGILTPFGMALIIHSFLRIGFKKECRNIFVVFMVIVSIFHFNRAYAGYQGAYYMDRGLQEYLKLNPELKQYKNIGLIENDGGKSWYINNGIFEEIYGDENRLVENLNYTMRIDLGTYSTCFEREWYNMTGCDPFYNTVDCVILYSNAFTHKEAMSARIHEILGEDISDRLMANSDFRVIYPGDEGFSDYVQE